MWQISVGHTIGRAVNKHAEPVFRIVGRADDAANLNIGSKLIQ
jgi:hypothetical protein